MLADRFIVQFISAICSTLLFFVIVIPSKASIVLCIVLHSEELCHVQCFHKNDMFGTIILYASKSRIFKAKVIFTSAYRRIRAVCLRLENGASFIDLSHVV